jgi:hypothetical protein
VQEVQEEEEDDGVEAEEEEDDANFEITDFSTVTPWERLIQVQPAKPETPRPRPAAPSTKSPT